MNSLIIVGVAAVFLMRFDQGYDANVDGWTPVIVMAVMTLLAIIDAFRGLK